MDERQLYELGFAFGKLSPNEKRAGDPELSYGLVGKLYKSHSGWLLLSVPNALGRGAFDALNEPGVELPTSETTGQYNAHISVMRPEELDGIEGGADAITERGHEFTYTLGPVQAVSPEGWGEVSKCWFIKVKSPDLEKLRKSYGLSARPNNDEFDFHITFAIRKKSVLTTRPVSKAASLIHNPLQLKKANEGEDCPHCGASMERGDDGYCNRCGELWPADAGVKKTAAIQKLLDSLGVEVTADGNLSVLNRLQLAKRESDRKNYAKKVALLRSVMGEHPGEFGVDSRSGTMSGITHTPTGFKIHMPTTAIPIGNKRGA